MSVTLAGRRAKCMYDFGVSMGTCLLVVFLTASAMGSQSAAGDDPDRLYANRTDLASAKRAVDLWSAALRRDPSDYEALWKIARANYWLGRHVAEKDRMPALEDGIERGRLAASLAPNRPEGHFWMAANMGAAGELSSRA